MSPVTVESAEKGKQELISGIEVDANQEAERILSQAEKQMAENRAGVEKQVQGILREAEERARLHAETAARRILSGVDVEVRRKLLRGQHRVLSEVIEKVRERMRELAKSEQYRTVLKNWIVEAMIGLGSERAEVSCSRIDLPFIDEKLLSEAAGKVKRLTGRVVELRRSSNDPGSGPETPRGQGVILTDPGRRIAFNNQIDTRLLRKQRQIQTLIYDALFRGIG